jgi:hypothetical protein
MKRLKTPYWNGILFLGIITARVKTKYRKMTIVQCYALTEDGKPEDKESFLLLSLV